MAENRGEPKTCLEIFLGARGFGCSTYLCRAVRPVGGGRLKSGGMGRTGLTAAGEDEAGITSPWQKIEENPKTFSYATCLSSLAYQIRYKGNKHEKPCIYNQSTRGL